MLSANAIVALCIWGYANPERRGVADFMEKIVGVVFLNKRCGFIRVSISVMKTNSILWWMILCLHVHTRVWVYVCVFCMKISPQPLSSRYLYTHKKIQFERVRCKKISLAVICCKLSFCSKKYDYGAGEMTPWLRTIAALTEVLCLIPIIPMMVHNHL